MKHIVLFRFEQGYKSSPLFNHAVQVFEQLRAALPQDILQVRVEENVVVRDDNMDIMVKMDLAKDESLQTYLHHPIHRALVQEWMPHLVSHCSFDY